MQQGHFLPVQRFANCTLCRRLLGQWSLTDICIALADLFRSVLDVCVKWGEHIWWLITIWWFANCVWKKQHCLHRSAGLGNATNFVGDRGGCRKTDRISSLVPRGWRMYNGCTKMVAAKWEMGLCFGDDCYVPSCFDVRLFWRLRLSAWLLLRTRRCLQNCVFSILLGSFPRRQLLL